MCLHAWFVSFDTMKLSLILGNPCFKIVYTHKGRNVRKRTSISYAHNEDSDQTAQLRSLIRVFAVRIKKFCILGYPKSAQSDQTGNVQGNLNLRWVQMPEGMLSNVTAHIYRRGKNRIITNHTRVKGCNSGVVGCGEGVVYLTSPGRPTDIG